MSGRQWSVSPLLQPKIKATIKNDLWNLTSQTFAHTNLTVLQNTFLTLLCVAVYPVFWTKDQERYLQERLAEQLQESCNAFDESPTCSHLSTDGMPKSKRICVSDTHMDCADRLLISQIDEYHATIAFNATSAIVGNYTCYGIRVQLGTSVVIRIRQETDASHPQLLQGGFDKVVLPMFDPWPWPEDLSFVYSTPPDGQGYMPVIKTGENKQCTDENTTVLPFETRNLSPNIGEALFEFEDVFRPSVACGGYRVLILPGSWTWSQTDENTIEQFGLEDISVTPTYRQEERRRKEEGSVLLTTGRLYNIHYYLTQKFFAAWLEANETEPISERTMPCDKKAASEESAERCGLVAAAAMSQCNISLCFVVLLVNATRPCTFTVGYDGTGIASGTNTTGLAYLHIAVADPEIFGLSRAAAAVQARSITPRSNIRCSTEVFVNQSLVLQCLAPACQLEATVWWCYEYSVDEMCRWETGAPWSADNILPVMKEPNITIKQHGLHTLGISLMLPHIQKSQQGSYKCAVLNTFTRTITFPETGSIYVKVSDPVKPSFTDGKGPGKLTVQLSENKTATLDCRVTARPEPNITWSCSSNEKKIQCPIGTAARDNSSIEVHQPGTYTCTAKNDYGTTQREYEVHPAPNTWPVQLFLYIIGAILFGILFAILILLMIERRRRNRRLDGYFKELADLLNSPQETLHIDTASPLNDQASLLPYNRNFEIDRNSFAIKGKLLGSGEFGSIYKGEVKAYSESLALVDVTSVAVKMPKDPANHYHHHALLDELRILCHIRPHANVLALIGACTTTIEKRQLFILTDFCEHGSLKNYLVENRQYFEAVEEEHRSVKTFLSYAYQAANGMAHLAAENIIHRDLALRNLLLTNAHIIKISNFGMSRKHDSIYYRRLAPDVPIPLFWMALESLISDQYTQKSDVWSFGIVLWEMFNCGRRPYPDHEPDMAFRSWLRASEQNRLGPPKIVCEEIYHLMRECWKVDPTARPTFSQCKRQIAETLDKKFPSVYTSLVRSLSEAGIDMVLNQRALSARAYRLESQSPHISIISIGISDHQDDGSSDQYAMTLNENPIDRAEDQPPECPQVSTEIELCVMAEGQERIAKPYVAASL